MDVDAGYSHFCLNYQQPRNIKRSNSKNTHMSLYTKIKIKLSLILLAFVVSLLVSINIVFSSIENTLKVIDKQQNITFKK